MPPKTKKKAREGAKQESEDAILGGIPSLFPSASFQGLPYEIKRLVVRGTGLGLPDLLRLSHTCRLWREATIEENIYTPYFECIDPQVRIHFAKIINPPPIRTFVMLAARLNCMHCKSRPTHMIFVPLMLCLCPRCIVDEEGYGVASKSRAVAQYHLTQKDITSIPRFPYGEGPEGGSGFIGLSGEMVSLKLVKELAMKKYGGTEESLEAYLTEQKRIAKEKWDEKIRAYDNRPRRSKKSQLNNEDSMGKKLPKRRPKEPEILRAPSILADYILPQSTIWIGLLHGSNDFYMDYESLVTCRVCSVIAMNCRENEFAIPIPTSTQSNDTKSSSTTDRGLIPLKYHDPHTLAFRSGVAMTGDEVEEHTEDHFDALRRKCVEGCKVTPTSKIILVGTCYNCCNYHAMKRVYGEEVVMPQSNGRIIWAFNEDSWEWDYHT